MYYLYSHRIRQNSIPFLNYEQIYDLFYYLRFFFIKYCGELFLCYIIIFIFVNLLHLLNFGQKRMSRHVLNVARNVYTNLLVFTLFWHIYYNFVCFCYIRRPYGGTVDVTEQEDACLFKR